MRIENAEFKGGVLQLACSPVDGIKFACSFKPGDYEITWKKHKRSNDANSYAWVLIDRIAEKLHEDKTDVYRNAVREIGGVSEPPESVPLFQLETYIREWTEGHLGRQVRILPGERINHVTAIRVKGSSDYDTAQMSRLIDSLVQDAQALGIETKDPKYIESLLNSWEARQ